jgi:hypothetical protein
MGWDHNKTASLPRPETAQKHWTALRGAVNGTMEQIHTQANDLRYISQPPVALPSDSPGAYSPPVSATPGDNSAPGQAGAGDGAYSGFGGKRKSEDEASAKQQRSKRNRVSEMLFSCRWAP